MSEIFKQRNTFFLLLMLLFLGSKVTAQGNENDGGGFNWDGMNDLDNVDIYAGAGDNDSWDYPSLYWDHDPPNYIGVDDNYSDFGSGGSTSGQTNNNANQDPSTDKEKQTVSKVELTKKVKPGETHTQEVKVLRDPNTSTEKKVVDLIINGEKVGTVTFDKPIRDSNGVDIYSRMTVELLPTCPVAITSITFDNPETSKYDDTKQSKDGNLEKVAGDLSLYKDLGIVEFNTHINKEEDVVIIGSTVAATDSSTNKKDPCVVAKELTTIAASPTYKKAINDIKKAAIDNFEHSITLGITNAQITAAPIVHGGRSVYVTTNWPGAFTVLHNHPNDTPPSGGDIYAIARLKKNNSNFDSCFAITGDGTYALAITDLAAAQEFSAKYMANRGPDDNKEYPGFMISEMLSVWNDMHSYTMESQAKAKAFVVNKYNGGVTFFKQKSDGLFYPLLTKQTTLPNGSKMYNPIPCI
ncbi:hypothetical protein [Flavobacterium gelatinilyticum]|uniref:hypothetical protein n=1 Tax=Flavobacterium gelatinilyticum TaxID=3003260 RepID=UPI0024817A14|nr:hypothetical protein [Flavobacterium gelatinilyticum]